MNKSDDLVVYTAAPPGSEELIKKHGLLSAKALIENPEVLAAVIENRRNTGHAMTAEEFAGSVKKRLKDRPWSKSQEGPSVFFGMPDPDKITDKHPSRQFQSDMYKVDLGSLLKDVPDTVVHGAELIPYKENMSDADKDKRRSRLSADQIKAYLRTPPKELWKHYDDPEGRMYAADVPHGFVVTPSGTIPGKYLKRIHSMNKSAYVQGYLDKEAAPSATELSAAIGAALGIGSGTLSNFVLSKMLGYEGNWMNYVASGAIGGLAGGIGGAAAGDAVKKRIDYYRANPGEAGDILRKIEKDPRLRKVGDALRRNPLMRPIRRALGRPFVSLKRPVGYDSSEINENFKKSVEDVGLKKTLLKVVKGERLWGGKMSDDLQMRSQAQKAYFDLPLDADVMNKYFKVSPNDPKKWEYSDEVPNKEDLDQSVRIDFLGRHEYPGGPITYEPQFKTKGDKEYMEGTGGFIAGYRSTRDKGSDIAEVNDRWDYENYRGGKGYKTDVPEAVQSGSRGYDNDLGPGWSQYDSPISRVQHREKERNKHLLKNIVDILVGNPITLHQKTDLSIPAKPYRSAR